MLTYGSTEFKHIQNYRLTRIDRNIIPALRVQEIAAGEFAGFTVEDIPITPEVVTSYHQFRALLSDPIAVPEEVFSVFLEDAYADGLAFEFCLIANQTFAERPPQIIYNARQEPIHAIVPKTLLLANAHYDLTNYFITQYPQIFAPIHQKNEGLAAIVD